jgi:hypothetical protein
MKSTLFIVIALIGASESVLSDEQSFRATLMTLPPKYLGDIPLVSREKFLKAVESDAERLDAAKGWLHWFADGGDVGGTSMVWAKELPRPGKKPLVFVHMAKPFADARNKPAPNQTVILEQVGEEWVDVTKTVIPSTVDMTMHFRTRKADTTVEAAPWKEVERRDGRGTAYTYGDRVMDLRWTGKEFVIEKAPSKELTKN